jgi:beta-glucosidase
VQVYVHQRVGSVTRPVKALKAFQRVTLAPNESRTLVFKIEPSAFELWDLDMKRVVEPGTYDIMAGSNSRDLKSVPLDIGP